VVSENGETKNFDLGEEEECPNEEGEGILELGHKTASGG